LNGSSVFCFDFLRCLRFGFCLRGIVISFGPFNQLKSDVCLSV